MILDELEPGDIIFAATNIINDGSMPGFNEKQLIANQGQRGVIINTGYLEEQPDKALFLVKFESSDGDLGPAVACWPKELCLPEEAIVS